MGLFYSYWFGSLFCALPVGFWGLALVILFDFVALALE